MSCSFGFDGKNENLAILSDQEFQAKVKFPRSYRLCHGKVSVQNLRCNTLTSIQIGIIRYIYIIPQFLLSTFIVYLSVS